MQLNPAALPPRRGRNDPQPRLGTDRFEVSRDHYRVASFKLQIPNGIHTSCQGLPLHPHVPVLCLSYENSTW